VVFEEQSGIEANAAESMTPHSALKIENKENIWFWHHWPPALPLGHNCSNPSLRLSA
jgi:hypothetical protein